MPKIENNNCKGLCSEKVCSQKYTHFINYIIKGVPCVIPLCKEHHDKILFD